MEKIEFKKFYDYLILKGKATYQTDEMQSINIDDFLNLPNGEASNVSTNELTKEVCEHVWKQAHKGPDKICIKCNKFDCEVEQTGR